MHTYMSTTSSRPFVISFGRPCYASSGLRNSLQSRIHTVRQRKRHGLRPLHLRSNAETAVADGKMPEEDVSTAQPPAVIDQELGGWGGSYIEDWSGLKVHPYEEEQDPYGFVALCSVIVTVAVGIYWTFRPPGHKTAAQYVTRQPNITIIVEKNQTTGQPALTDQRNPDQSNESQESSLVNNSFVTTQHEDIRELLEDDLHDFVPQSEDIKPTSDLHASLEQQTFDVDPLSKALPHQGSSFRADPPTSYFGDHVPDAASLFRDWDSGFGADPSTSYFADPSTEPATQHTATRSYTGSYDQQNDFGSSPQPSAQLGNQFDVPRSSREVGPQANPQSYRSSPASHISLPDTSPESLLQTTGGYLPPPASTGDFYDPFNSFSNPSPPTNPSTTSSTPGAATNSAASSEAYASAPTSSSTAGPPSAQASPEHTPLSTNSSASAEPEIPPPLFQNPFRSLFPSQSMRETSQPETTQASPATPPDVASSLQQPAQASSLQSYPPVPGGDTPWDTSQMIQSPFATFPPSSAPSPSYSTFLDMPTPAVAEAPSRAVQLYEVQELSTEATLENLRQRTQISLRAAGAASEASRRASAYSAAASSAASKAAEAAERAALAATSAQLAMETAAEDAIVAAEARVARAVEMAAEAENKAASAAALTTAYQDIAETQASVAESAANLPAPVASVSEIDLSDQPLHLQPLHLLRGGLLHMWSALKSWAVVMYTAAGERLEPVGTFFVHLWLHISSTVYGWWQWLLFKVYG